MENTTKTEVTHNVLSDYASVLGVPQEQFYEELKRVKALADEMDRFTKLMEHAGHQLIEEEPLNLECFFANNTISSMAAVMFAAEMIRGGGKNFFTFDYDISEFGRINVTIQKPDHKTPAQLIQELDDEILALKDECIALLSLAVNDINTSWLFCKAFLSMQAALVCIEQGDIYEAKNWLAYVNDNAVAEMPDDMTISGLEKWFDSNMVSNNGSHGFLTHRAAVNALRKSFPATSKAIDEATNDPLKGNVK